MMGTYTQWVLLFAWVLLFRKLIATGLIDTYIHMVLVIDGYVYSRVYGMCCMHIQCTCTNRKMEIYTCMYMDYLSILLYRSFLNMGAFYAS